MGNLKKFFRSLIFKKYDQFAENLGYPNWDIASENTFGIYQTEVDAWYSATQLPNKKWAVWTDNQGEPPYSFKMFSSWGEAIKYLRKSFEENGLPEEYWKPEGFDEDENVFSKEPDKEKML